jgi:hypothetical protein
MAQLRASSGEKALFEKKARANLIGLAHAQNIHYNTCGAKDHTAKKDVHYGSSRQDAKAKQTTS